MIKGSALGMFEQFNQELSLSGEIPSGHVNVKPIESMRKPKLRVKSCRLVNVDDGP